MTGPEHYREAERLAACADELDHGNDDESAWNQAQAQVHATLALAAATAATLDGWQHASWIAATEGVS